MVTKLNTSNSDKKKKKKKKKKNGENSKTQIVTKFQNSICEKLKRLNCDKNQKI